MPLVSISAKDIDTAGIKVDTDLPVDWINRELSDTEAEAKAPGHLSARLSKTANNIVVRGDVTASVTMPCARCLAPTNIEIQGELSLLLQPAPAAHGVPGSRSGRGGAAHDKAGSGGSGGGETSMWARAAAKAIPEWGSASPAKSAKGEGSKPAGKAKAAGATGSGKGSKKAKEPEYEFAAEEAEHDTYDGETVVLDDFVREALLLELPNFPLCSEACPGIRPAELAPGAEPSAASERVDPRLAPLGALRAKKAHQTPEDTGKPTKKKSNKE